jgi:1,5-anhydro-D-fructose reductase (1,5-anhydro-D-mannitol-forming)
MNPVGYGIIGFGRFAEKSIAPAIHAAENSRLVAIQKRSLDAAREKAEAYSVPLAFDSVHDLVRHPDIDAVFVASANSCHHAETLAAAEAGKHVLVEKPMALNVREAEQMIEACARYGVKLMVGHMVRLSPLVRRIRELVRESALGPLISARADYMYDGRLSHRHWLYDRDIAGGGPVFDIGVHCLDTLRYVLDDEIVSLKSEAEPRPTKSLTEASAYLLLRFSRGTLGSIFCSYLSPIRRSFIEVVGTEGMVAATDFTLGDADLQLTVTTQGNGPLPNQHVETFIIPNLYIQEVSQFSRCILEGGEPDLSGGNGLANQRVLDQAMDVAQASGPTYS